MSRRANSRVGRCSARLRAAVFIAAAVSVLALPSVAAATTVVLEDTAPSRAALVGGAVQGATTVASPSKPMAIYGTLTPTEDLDAFAFVAPRTGETSITLLLQDPLLADSFAPTLSLSEEGTGAIKGQRPARTPAGSFDIYSLETLRPSTSLRASLVAGRRYVVVVGPGQGSGLVIPYTVRLATDGTAAGAADPAGLTAIPALWTGRYAQRSFRPGAAFVLLMMIAAAILALAAGVSVLIARPSGHPGQEAEQPTPVAVAPRPPLPQSSVQPPPGADVEPPRRSDDRRGSVRAAVTLPSIRPRKVKVNEVSEAYVAEAARPAKPAESEALPVQEGAPSPGVDADQEPPPDVVPEEVPVPEREVPTPAAQSEASESPKLGQRLKRVRHKDADSDQAERAAMPDLEDFLGAYDLERPAEPDPPTSE